MVSPNDSVGEDRHDRILLEYLRAVDSGENVDREAFIAAHPEHVDELRA